MHRRVSICLGSIALLAGCTVGPNYTRPETTTPPSWTQALPQSTLDIRARRDTWWESFNDPLLTKYVTRALQNNHTREAAAARIAEARAILESTRAPIWPQLNWEGQAFRGNQGYLTGNKTIGVAQTDLAGSLSLDLFGNQRRLVEGATATLEGLEASLEDVQASLIADVVSTYITYRELQNRIALLQTRVVVQKQLLTLTQDLFDAGLDTGLDVAALEAQLQNVASQLPPLAQTQAAAALSLTVLLGENPGTEDAILRAHRTIPEPEGLIALDTPAEVISRRPDIKNAEKQLAAATALHGAAIANLYPQISLGGLLGFQSTTVARNSSIWSVGPTFTMPLLNFGLLQGQIDAADARQAQALAIYKLTVLAAFGDIETRVATYREAVALCAKLSAQIQALMRAQGLAQTRYTKGLAPRLDVLNAESAVLATQDAWLAAEASRARAVAALYKALGFGG